MKKHQEDMDYKNLLLRFLFSIIIFVVYLFTLTNYIFIILLGFFIYLVIFYEILKNFKKHFFLIFIYITFSLINFLFYCFNFFEIYLFNLLIFVIVSFDTFSYFVGNLFGKRYIFYKISPNKTLEGYIGGLFFTNILYLLYLFLFSEYKNITTYFFLINLIVIASLIGDLIQSFFKRKNKIKDSSNYLPGHGGFFDRFDSFISSIVFLSTYSYIYS